MQVELNKHFKPEECVLYCGEAVYATLQGRTEPLTPDGYIRMWKLRVLRRGTNIHYYAKVNNGRATLVKGVQSATLFPSYKETEEIAFKMLETGNILEAEIIEVLKFMYEEDTYAT